MIQTAKDNKRACNRSYYLRNRERIIARARSYSQENKDVIRERSREYYTQNRESLLSKVKERALLNKDRKATYDREYRLLNAEKKKKADKLWRTENSARKAENDRLYKKENRALLNLKEVERIRNNPEYRLSVWIHKTTHRLVKKRNATKQTASLSLVGCTTFELKSHLESQFLPEMSWENHSRDGWHIDHIRPLASFDLSDPTQLAEACHYTNLQPLWAVDNLRKGATLLV